MAKVPDVGLTFIVGGQREAVGGLPETGEETAVRPHVHDVLHRSEIEDETGLPVLPLKRYLLKPWEE